jgi:NADPH:quinone reductase-like Zn-dependent oxidoreductase
MKAAYRIAYGPPDVLAVREVDKPTPKDDEVLIKVHATTVNRTDCAILSGWPFIMRFFIGLFKPKAIPGTDFAGEVVAVGERVQDFRAGDRVWGFDDSCIASQAQYMTFPEKKAIAIIPENISYEEAAASAEGAHYARNFINKLKLGSESTVLVYGATGAIGSAAVQLLKSMGVFVTAVGNTKNVELLKSLGADKVVDYTREDFTRDTVVYDSVFDAVGKSSFGKCKPLLRAGGVYMSSELGAWWQNLFLALLTPLFGKKKVIFPVPVHPRKSILLIKELIEKGKFKAVIDRTYPLEKIAEAYRYVSSGQKTGNVVITIAHSD